MIKEEFLIPSQSAGQHLHGILWTPEGTVQAVLQIVHGMIEYIDRYDEFATFLCQNGIAVIGHDHLGHGKTAARQEDLGFFHETNGRNLLIQDMYRVTKEMKQRFPAVPHFILGHSMGSFCTRKYLTFFGHEIDGAILMGTGDLPLVHTYAGKEMAAMIIKRKGKRFCSPFLEKITFGTYLARIKQPRTAKDWLSRHEGVVDAYLAHPHCTFMFTASAYHDLFSIISYDTKKIRFDHIPRSLPILFISGEDDPVGHWGKGPRALYELYQEEGFQDVSLRLYPHARHEILNETNRQEVFNDIASWLAEKIEI